MNGRELFQKYGIAINNIVRVVKIIPVSKRYVLLNKTRYYDGKLEFLIRYLIVASLANSIGTNVAIFPGVYIFNIENMKIGNNVSIHEWCYIDAEGGITIGDNVSIAHRCSILSSNHSYDNQNVPIKYQEMSLSKTIINDDVWVGCGSVILAGTIINSGCVIGANSTVTKAIPSNSIAVGSPAKVIKNRV